MPRGSLVRTRWGQGDTKDGKMGAPCGPKTLPRELVWRPLGRFCVDFGVKMGLELEIVDLAKTSKKQCFFNGFQCLEGV